jgi:hypothetical protein
MSSVETGRNPLEIRKFQVGRPHCPVYWIIMMRPLRSLWHALWIGLGLVVAAGAQPASPAASRGYLDKFLVDASVAGNIRPDLRELGRSAVQYLPLSETDFRLRAAGLVEHRQKKTVYKFKIDMSFALQGRKLTVTANANSFNKAADEFRNKIERIVPFIYLVKFLPVPGPLDEPSRTYQSRTGYFVLRYKRIDLGVEVSLHQDDELVARFTLGGETARPHDLNKIAIPAMPEVMLNFNRNPGRG